MDSETRTQLRDLRDRVEELEATVAQLQRDDDDSTTTGGDGPWDRYDRYVLDTVDEPADASPQTLLRAYSEAGIVDKGKQKRRAKRLKQLAGGEE